MGHLIRTTCCLCIRRICCWLIRSDFKVFWHKLHRRSSDFLDFRICSLRAHLVWWVSRSSELSKSFAQQLQKITSGGLCKRILCVRSELLVPKLFPHSTHGNRPSFVHEILPISMLFFIVLGISSAISSLPSSIGSTFISNSASHIPFNFSNNVFEAIDGLNTFSNCSHVNGWR